ncbi:restriction endonuclease subunit S [Empedobacter falsenii]|uniref:Restriction endonuclease subunit S n=1 Tax=Empedobacter falsenii TaxID=343874 RepID=A0A3R8UPJ5_9FLAO|nr:restriction endonuclease subunit S [Empedobacter falsenii]RRT91440.1 restriction endonuclease subunit S [Empedobacter falsenii]RRT91493.1 restriction endonuclease subunit S [Empedobacter falsenii]
MAKKVTNVPNLRFPEFTEEWETKKLGEIGEIVTGSTPPTNDESYYGGEHLFVSPADIQTNRYVNNSKTTLTLKGFRKGRKIKKGSSLFVCIGSTIGKVAQASEDCVTNQQINSIVSLEHNADFVFSLLEFSSKKIKLLSAEQAVPIINKTTFSNVQINIPSLSEQAKIASFLSIIDKRIQTQNKIIKELKTLKGATAKKIFSQEFRFNDDNGNEFPKWEEVFLENVCDIKKGEQFNKEDLSEIGSHPCLNGGILPSGFSEKYNTDENTITISEGGNSCGFVNFMKRKFWLGGHCYKILLLKKISLIYFYQLLKFNEQNIMNLRVGSGLPNIQLKSLKKFTVKISSSENEQTKIANFLSAIDSKIDVENQLLQKLEVQKKYLLQQMFI